MAVDNEREVIDMAGMLGKLAEKIKARVAESSGPVTTPESRRGSISGGKNLPSIRGIKKDDKTKKRKKRGLEMQPLVKSRFGQQGGGGNPY